MAKALLGISPGTRIIGLAVICEGELVEWKVKTFKESWSRNKRKAILAAIDRMCAYHGIQAIAIKRPDPLRSSPQLERLVESILRHAERGHIPLWQYSLSDLDYDIRQGSKQTRGMLSEQVADKHPQLRSKLLREQSNRKEYYTKMFEAVAMAGRCRDQ